MSGAADVYAAMTTRQPADTPPADRLTGCDRLVYAYYVCRANGAKVCWPAIETVAADLDVSRRTVTNANRKLEGLGLIRIDRQHRQPNRYVIPHLVGRADFAPVVPDRVQNLPSNDPSRVQNLPTNDSSKTLPLSNTFTENESPVTDARARRAATQTTFLDQEPKPPKHKRRSTVDRDFWPTEAGIAFAAKCGVADLGRTVAMFRDYHAAKGNLMADWPAAWRTWCMNDQRYRERDAARGQRPLRPNEVRPGVFRTSRYGGYSTTNV